MLIINESWGTFRRIGISFLRLGNSGLEQEGDTKQSLLA